MAKLYYILTFFLFFSYNSRGGTRRATISLPRVRREGRLIILAIGDSISCFRCHNRPVKFRCRLTRRFTGSLKLSLGIGIIGSRRRLIDDLLGKRNSLMTCGLVVAGPLGCDLVCYNRRSVAQRMVVREEKGGTLGSIARLMKGGICIGSKGCHAHLRGLGHRLKKKVSVYRVSSSDMSSRSLVA